MFFSRTIRITLSWILLPAIMIYAAFSYRALGSDGINSYKVETSETTSSVLFYPGSAVNQQLTTINHGFSILSNPYRYSAYYSDSESAMSYCQARYYSPDLMRFINRDTYGVSNRYAYCSGDPMEYVDPSGHLPDGSSHISCERLWNRPSCIPLNFEKAPFHPLGVLGAIDHNRATKSDHHVWKTYGEGEEGIVVGWKDEDWVYKRFKNVVKPENLQFQCDILNRSNKGSRFEAKIEFVDGDYVIKMTKCFGGYPSSKEASAFGAKLYTEKGIIAADCHAKNCMYLDSNKEEGLVLIDSGFTSYKTYFPPTLGTVIDEGIPECLGEYRDEEAVNFASLYRGEGDFDAIYAMCRGTLKRYRGTTPEWER